VTPSEKPGRSTNGTDPEADRTTVLATGDEAGAASENGRSSDVTMPATQSPDTEREDDLELSHVAVPPPWQRVNSDAAYLRRAPATSPERPALADAPGEVTIDYSNADGLPRPATPPSMDRPIVTGAGAPRAYGDYSPPGGAASPPRTTVHLENTSAAGPTGTVRPTPGGTPSALRRPGRGPRRANLQIKRFDPWSVLKLSLVLGVALFFVWLVAVGALYAVLDGMGVWDKINGISTDLLQGNAANSEPLISAGRVFGIAAIVGAINIVLFSALATVGAFVYNVSADLAGGLEVTLAERE
jgi:hypothetical protein